MGNFFGEPGTRKRAKRAFGVAITLLVLQCGLLLWTLLMPPISIWSLVNSVMGFIVGTMLLVNAVRLLQRF